MYDSILIPTDGSEQTEAAVEHALTLAETYDAKVHALYVVEMQASYILTVGLSDEKMAEYEEYGEETVTEVVNRASEHGIDGKGVLRKGNVAEETVDYAEENDIDGIVMGRQGHGAIERYVGSTAERVVRMTEIPVTVIG
jgi:nucleotide-binding universal stress UspA family protein